jgi:hypothetical protein
MIAQQLQKSMPLLNTAATSHHAFDIQPAMPATAANCMLAITSLACCCCRCSLAMMLLPKQRTLLQRMPPAMINVPHLLVMC